MKLAIPELSLVLLVGTSGSGKSTFGRKHFKPTEVISSDYCRGLVADDENDQTVSADAFDVLNYIAGKRLAAGRLTVVDATNVQREARKPLIELARRHHCLVVAIVFDLPERLCLERNRVRPDRQFGPQVIRRQAQNLRRSLRELRAEGISRVFVLNSVEAVDAAEIEREALWTDRRTEHGPFDIIGDIHGCFDELRELLGQLGYEVKEMSADSSEARPSPQASPQRGEGVGQPSPLPFPRGRGGSDGPGSLGSGRYRVSHPEGRRVILLGDLVDRGPKIPEVLRLGMSLVGSGAGLCIMGNHENKLLRKLHGRNVQVTHGLAETLSQLEQEPPEFTDQVREFLDGLLSHYVLDEGKLVVAHAGLKQELQGRASAAVREFALYGETTGETDEFGLPVRGNWAGQYRGPAMVVYGHTPVPEPEWLNRTINVDTGCVFGGRLTALRYPEQQLAAVPSARVYYEPVRPLVSEAEATPALTAQQRHDDLLDIQDVLGKRSISTRLLRHIAIREENAITPLEVMSRFAVDPRWLVYLPPTMSPSETTRQPGLLEHPTEAFAYYRGQQVATVVCEEKHMGSRAVVIVCRDEEVARRRFGVVDGSSGICYTRTGRPFFDQPMIEQQFLARVRAALDTTGFWSKLQTDWVCLDCELMPWSAKAQGLLYGQYAPVGAAARAATTEAVGVLQAAASAGRDVSALLSRFESRADMVAHYASAYRPYCWPVESIDDLKLAPFHLLATEGAVHVNRDHHWHMETLAEICRADPALLVATPYQTVDLEDSDSEAAAIQWWTELTGRGGEGMVVKPLDFIAQGPKGLTQPAVKCRGPEYLRIIYGPEYTAPEHLNRLRQRGLSAKRSLALRELALGVESLERFVQREPLYRIHECVFGVLALESEPVDPRL